MKVKINIKKLTPTLSIGAAAAAATPAIVTQCQNASVNSVVVNNYIDQQAMGSVVKTKQDSSTTIKLKGLPALNINSGESLGAALKQYLLHAQKDSKWINNEKELLKSSSSSSYRIRSEMFKEAKRKIQSNRRVDGGETRKVCRKAYQLKEVSKADARVIRDVLHYCRGSNNISRKSHTVS